MDGAARPPAGRPPCSGGLRYFTTWDTEGSQTRRGGTPYPGGGTPSAGLGQAAPRIGGATPTAGLKQPSLWCMVRQALGRRNAAPVQGTRARPVPPALLLRRKQKEVLPRPRATRKGLPDDNHAGAAEGPARCQFRSADCGPASVQAPDLLPASPLAAW